MTEAASALAPVEKIAVEWLRERGYLPEPQAGT
jgi:hypothetical protein